MNASFRARQILSVAIVEYRRALGGGRTWGLILFACVPIAVALIRVLMFPEGARMDVARTYHETAQIFALFHLRFIIFFGCAFLFVKSFRGEVLQKTLHLGLLLPLRRQDWIVGKYLGALAVALTIFLPSTVGLVTLYRLANGVPRALHVTFSVQGWGNLAAYLGIVTLAAIGYGALFLLAGLFSKNPMVPAALYLGFEIIAPFLPLAIRAFSIAGYLHALLPEPVSLGTLAITGAGIPGWLGVILLLAVATGAVRLAGWKAQRYQIDYS